MSISAAAALAVGALGGIVAWNAAPELRCAARHLVDGEGSGRHLLVLSPLDGDVEDRGARRLAAALRREGWRTIPLCRRWRGRILAPAIEAEVEMTTIGNLALAEQGGDVFLTGRIDAEPATIELSFHGRRATRAWRPLPSEALPLRLAAIDDAGGAALAAVAEASRLSLAASERGERAATLGALIDRLHAAFATLPRDAAQRPGIAQAIAAAAIARAAVAPTPITEADLAAARAIVEDGGPAIDRLTRAKLVAQEGFLLLLAGEQQGDDRRLREAELSLAAALPVFDRATARAGWAVLQLQRGRALIGRARLGGDRLLAERAVAAFRGALEIFSPVTLPHDYATAKLGLAQALILRSDDALLDDADEALREASAALGSGDAELLAAVEAELARIDRLRTQRRARAGRSHRKVTPAWRRGRRAFSYAAHTARSSRGR